MRVHTENVTNINIVFATVSLPAMNDWSQKVGAHWTQFGPLITDLRASATEQRWVGHIPGTWTQEEVEQSLAMSGVYK